jgi:hypothetical protein
MQDIFGSRFPTYPTQVKPTRGGRGQNGDPTPSSVQRSDVPRSTVAQRSDAALDAVVAGTHLPRPVNAGDLSGRMPNVSNHPHMKPADVGGAPGGSVPDKMGVSDERPVRQPDCSGD